MRMNISSAVPVACERRLLDAAMHARLFESLESRSLSVTQPRLRAAFGESPSPAASLYQQEFNAAAAHSIADRRDLLAAPQLM